VQAKDAIQGQKYVLPPNNVMALYLVATGGQQSFLPCSGNGQPLAGGAPILFAYDAQVFELAPEPPPAPAVPPPPPVTQVVRDAAAPPPPPPLQAPPAFVPPSPPQGQAQAEAPKRGRRTKAKMEAARAAEAQAAGTAQSTGFTLFVNAIPNTSFTDLSAYIADVTGDMEQQFGVPDVRAVMDDKSPIAFGRWKGVLAGLVKQSPPPPGAYAAFTKGNELTEVVVEALSSLCAPGALVRGV
jgi:type IV secretory pathway VirB10-like protein